MKYFIDTEFIQGFRKRHSLRGNKKADFFIDLISIGILAEDGRTYYAVSNEYKYNEADDWVKKNVILPLYIETVHGDNRNRYDDINFHKSYGKSNKQIAEEIKHFCDPKLFLHNTAEPELEFYGYYADYDWVLFCSLFGRMIDLPKGFPMYCRDLKQMLDDLSAYQENKYANETRLKSWLKTVKNHPEYPKQQNEHNALADAKWNKELYDFINQRKFLNQTPQAAAKINPSS